MAWYGALTGDAFRQWLITVAGGGRVSQGEKLDPFGTSMRHFAPAAEWLEMIEAGQELPARGGSGVQNYTDLRSAQLVAGEGAAATLTDLGTAVLDAWRSAGVLDDDMTHELTRCVAVVQHASALGVGYYLGMLRFWRQLRGTHDVDRLLAAPEALVLASYLNRTENGYNPWKVIEASRVDLAEVAPIDWAGLIAEAAGGADFDQAAQHLQTRVSDTRVADGRVLFCTALELHELAREDMADATAALARWRVPSA